MEEKVRGKERPGEEREGEMREERRQEQNKANISTITGHKGPGFSMLSSK